MERVSASLIEEIRNALVERYNRDQEIQQMIEEIGAEEGLNEKELSVIYQAYLEVKERMQYTANLMELWNQIEVVQDLISLVSGFTTALKAPRKSPLTWPRGIPATGSSLTATGPPAALAWSSVRPT